jgi:hypothetical protein
MIGGVMLHTRHWQTATLAKSDASRTRQSMLTLVAAYLIIGVVSWMYFFAIPLIMAAAICICIVLAWLPAGRQRAEDDSGGPASQIRASLTDTVSRELLRHEFAGRGRGIWIRDSHRYGRAASTRRSQGNVEI